MSRKLGDFQKQQIANSACGRARELVLRMAKEGCPLNEIARAVGTRGKHVRRFLDREGIRRDYPKSYKGHWSSRWKGGRTHTRGYVRVYMPEHPHNHNGYVMEHRLVMERALGRLLEPGEVVHHKDGNPANNSLSNLQLFSENREHLRTELKGRVPKWTPEGLARMRAGAEKSAARKRGKTWDDWGWYPKRRRDGRQKP